MFAAIALAPPTDELRPASADEPDGLLVLGVLSPERAMVADPRTGAIRQRRVPGGTLCHGPVLAIGDRVVLSGSRGRHAIARSLPIGLTGRGRSLGRAEAFVASNVPGRVWLGRWARPRRWSETATSRVSLREVDAAGRAAARTSTAMRAPSWGRLEAVVDDDFLVSDGRGLRLGSRRFRDAWLVAADRSRLAWCRSQCRSVELWSRAGERTLVPPAGVRPLLGGRAAFSPDGRRLAVPVLTSGRDRVAVVDLASGTWTVVRGAALAGYRSVAWSPSGRWLYFTGTRHRLLAWRDGARRPVRLPIDAGGAVMSIATTAAALSR